MKGKAITVPPVPGVATTELRALLDKVLPRADEQTEAELPGKIQAASITRTLTEVQGLMSVRRALLPALTGGSRDCGGRLRYGLHQGFDPCLMHMVPNFT